MVRFPLVSASGLLLAAMAVAACAPSPAPLDASGQPRECFFANRADSYSDGGDGLILVRDGARGVFEMEVTGVCPDIDWSRALAIEPLVGASRLCVGDHATLLVPSTLSRSVDRCPARVTRKVEPNA